MRRLSCRSVPSTNMPPAWIALSLSRANLRPISAMRASRSGPSGTSLQLVLDPHVGIAAELNIGAAAGHVGGDRDRARHARLRDDIGLLLVVARIEDGEDLGLGGPRRRRCRAPRTRSDR